MRLIGEHFRVVSGQRLGEEVESLDAGGLFDLDDPECPVAVRECRSCHVELRFEFPGGVRPRLMPLLGSVACESCSMEEAAAEERGKANASVLRRIESSGMPPALAAEATWDSLIMKSGDPKRDEQRQKAIEAARHWSTQERPLSGLLLYGPPGTGKTRLAATAARERLQRANLRWVSVGVLMAQLEGAWNDDERRTALKVLTSPEPAVLDDLDKIRPTGRTLAQIYTALDKREQAKSTVIITTNLAPAELSDKLGEVIVSRLRGMCLELPYPGPDLRMELQ